MLMLPIPSYINVEKLRGQPPNFSWSDDLPHGVLQELDKVTVHTIAGASDLAKVAFVIGCAEWVVYRFEAESSVDFAWDFIESSWARLIDPFLGRPWEPREWVWTGRADGSIVTALHSITNTFYGIDEGGGWRQEIPLASTFTAHVLGGFREFQQWRDAVVAHLVQHFPYDDVDPFGPPVPRTALDPSVELTGALREAALRSFLQSLNPERNRFLTSSHEQQQLRAAMLDDDDDE